MLILILAVLVAYVERTSIAHVIPYIRTEDNYDTVTLGYILSAFGWGYVIGLPLSGFIISRLGHRKTLSIIAIGWSLSALWFCSAHDALELALARLLLGLLEAPLFPLFVSWIGINSSYESGSFRISVVEAASYFGMAFSGPLTTGIASQWGWRPAYAVVGGLPIVIAIIALFLSGGLSNEKTIITAERKSDLTRAVRIFPFVICALGFLLYNFIKTFYSTWLPAILVQSFHFTSVSAAGLTFIQSILAPVASIAAGYASAALIKNQFQTRTARLLPMSIGFGLGCFVAAVPFLAFGIELTLIVSFVGVISTSALIWSVPNDLSRNRFHIAHIAGYLNAIANVGTIISPVAVGYLLGTNSGNTSVLVLLGCASLAALSCFFISYVFLRLGHDRR